MEIVVIGGGIGGLTAALAMAHSGHRVQVLERAARFAQPGPALRLAPNATAVLARLGVLDQVLDLGSRPRRAVLRDLGSGAELAELGLGAPLTARYHSPYVVAGRADLLSLLADACADADVELRAGRLVTGVDQSQLAAAVMGGPVVSCASGAMYPADAVVAADGACSAVRALLGESELPGDGWAVYRGTVPAGALASGSAADEVVAWTGPDAHFTQYPVRIGEVYEQVAVFRSHLYPLLGPPALAGTASPGGTDWGGPEELDDAFCWATEPVRAAVRRLRRDHWWRMLDRVPPHSWAADRVALLGDAVHPMPGYLAQGACQAIEDAAALAAALAECPGPRDVPAALASYQARRYPRALRVSRARVVWESGPLPGRPADGYAASDWLYAP